MPIVWLPAAVQDIIHIRTYISEEDPSSAQRIGLWIDKATARLSLMPHSGRPGRITGTRELVVNGTPYLVIYRVQNNRVEILRVLHGRQSFPDAP